MKLHAATIAILCASCASHDHGARELPGATSPVVPSPSEGGTGDGGASVMRRGEPAAPSIVVEPWQHGNRQGERIATAHYSIRTTLRSGDMRRFMPRFAELALAQYTQALGDLPLPSTPLESFVFGTREEWAAFTRERLGDEAAAYIELGRGGYTSRATAILYDIGPNDTLTILAHEGWHQYSQSVFREELPVWLEEGISTYMEGHRIVPETGEAVFMGWRNLERFGELRDAIRRDRLIPLEEILTRTPQSFLAQGRDRLLVYYGQVWALTHFLNEGMDGRCRDGLRRMLLDATRGEIGQRVAAAAASADDRRAIERGLKRGGVRALPGSAVARAYFGSDLAALGEAYREFITAITARGSMDSIWRGASPIKPKAAPAPAATP